jgi:Ulp1 family protease
VLWQHLSHTTYWNKRLWLIPIHRPKELHWVFVVAAVHERRLFLFDSLGERRGWRHNIQVCARCLCVSVTGSLSPSFC